MDIGSKNTPIIDGNNIFLISDNGYYVNLDRNSGKINDETEKIISLSLITISDDLKKPASRANIGSIVFKDQ